MIYCAEQPALQNKNNKYCFLRDTRLGSLSRPMNEILDTYKPIGPTLLVEWGDD